MTRVMMKRCGLVSAFVLIALAISLIPVLADGYPFYGILGASMYAIGGNISATIGQCYAGYNSPISLYTYSNNTLNWLGDLGMSQDKGANKSFGYVAKGTEIVVGIKANGSQDPTYWYYSGPGSRSYQVDGAHAKVDFIGFKGDIDGVHYDNPSYYGGPVLVGFEDLPMSSADGDFNDVTVVSLSGVSPVPEPGTILAACAILSPVGFVFRRRCK